MPSAACVRDPCGQHRMSESLRVSLFLTAVVAGALLAWQKVISGDAWLTLVLGLLLPSPLEKKGGTAGVGP